MRPAFQGHSRSSELRRIDRIWLPIHGNLSLSGTVSERRGDFGQKSKIFPTPVCVAHADDPPVEILWHCSVAKKITGMMHLPTGDEQEAQLMLTTGSTRLAVSRGQQTWYHSTCYIQFPIVQ